MTVSDDTMIAPKPLGPTRINSVDERGDELTRFIAVWNGALHEFRNHLTVLLATTTELRSVLPAPMPVEVSDALAEAERNVQSLSSLIAELDAAIKTGEPLIGDLDDVIERALRLAAPTLGRRVSVAVSKGRKTGVKNRGVTLECLLATLLVDLARAAEVKSGERARTAELAVHVDVGRGSLLIEIESNGGRPPPGSWRLLLASELGSRIDAEVTASKESVGYTIQFH